MNIVLVEHGDSKPYAFYVPDELLTLVHKDTGVLCKTKHGQGMAQRPQVLSAVMGQRTLPCPLGPHIPLKPIVKVRPPGTCRGAEDSERLCLR